MRIGTWNIERMGRGHKFADLYRDELLSLMADVVVVTEPGPGFHDLFPEAVMSPENRPSRKPPEAWGASLRVPGHEEVANGLGGAGGKEARPPLGRSRAEQGSSVVGLEARQRFVGCATRSCHAPAPSVATQEFS